MSEPPPFQIACADVGLAVAASGPVVVFDIGRALTLPRLATMRRAILQGRRHGKALVFGAFDVSDYDLRNLGGRGVREELIRISTSDPGRFAAVTMTIDGPGLVAQTIRSTASVAVLLGRPSYPLRILGDHHAAAEWLLGHGGRTGSTAEVLLAVDDARRLRRARAWSTPG